jgi:hypothetical protein
MYRSNLLERAKTLESFAYVTPERNRAFGGTAHNHTVDYIYNTINAFSDYFTVEKQQFVELYSAGNASFIVGGKEQGATLMTYSASGKVTAQIVKVANLGCEAVSLSKWELFNGDLSL